jgi:uncharacterized protein YbjT (DUF2867 family)
LKKYAQFIEIRQLKKTKSLFELYDKLSLFDAIEWVQGDIIDVPTLEHAFKGIDYVPQCVNFI